MSGLRKHGDFGYVHWGCRCDICASKHAEVSKARCAKQRERSDRSRPSREANKAALKLVRATFARFKASEKYKAARKANPELYKERDRVSREKNKEAKRIRELEKRRRKAAERKAAKEAARPAKEAAAKARESAKAKERYAALKRDHPERLAAQRAYAAKWRVNNRERELERKRAYYQKNKVKLLGQARVYRKTHPEIKRNTRRRKRKTDPCFRIAEGMRRRLRELLTPLQKKSTRSIGLIGCTRAELKTRLESLFLPGMSWSGYGTAWCIDHVKPCASFDLSDPEQQRLCFHYSNLQPLWNEVNADKSDSLDFDVPYALSQTPYPS